MAKWIQTNYEGVRYREHPTRKTGKNAKGVRKDRYYAIRYYLDGTRKEESLGWETHWKQSHPDGTISLEQEAVSRRAQLMKNQKEKTGPRTLKESKEQNDARQKAEAADRKSKADAQRTLAEYWEEAYFPAAKRSKKESSYQKEEQHFRLWIEPLLGSLPLRSIGLKQWDELVETFGPARSKDNALKETGNRTCSLSQRSHEYITGTLRRILKHAYDRRMMDDPPPTGKRIGISGPGNNRRTRVISYEEEAAIMEHLSLRCPYAWRITRFAFLTGCRVSESFDLTWAGVDLLRGTITFFETKNHDSKTIPITPPLAELLKSMVQGTPGDRVFTKKDGSPYREAPSAFKTAVRKLELNKGHGELDCISFHSIKHSVATRLGQRLGTRDLMDVMGWRTVQMAMRYVHSNEDAKARALSSLGSAPQTGKVLPFQAKV